MNLLGCFFTFHLPNPTCTEWPVPTATNMFLIQLEVNASALGVLFHPHLPILHPLLSEEAPPATNGSLPDEAAVALTVGIARLHVHALVLAEVINV